MSQADIDAWKLKTGKLSDDDFTRLSEAMGELAEAPIYIDDTPGINIIEMRTKARRLQVEHGVKLIIIDYLQLADSGRQYDNRVQEVSIISQNFKNLARELTGSGACLFSSYPVRLKPAGQEYRNYPIFVNQDPSSRMLTLSCFYTAKKAIRPSGENKFRPNSVLPNTETDRLGEIDLIFRGDRIRFYGVERATTAAAPSLHDIISN